MDTQKLKAHIALSLAGILFGANYWIAKGLMPAFMHPMQIIFVRGLATLILFWGVSFFMPPLNIEKHDHRLLILCSLLGVAINQVFFFTGLNYTSPVDTALIHAASPMMVMVFSALLLSEKVGPSKISGIVLGGLGAVLLILQGKTSGNAENQLLGNTLIFFNIMAYSLYLVLVKPLIMKYNAVTVMKWVFLYGFILIVPFSINDASKIAWTSFTPGAWFAITYIVVGTTFLAYLLTTFSLKALSAGVAGYYIYMQPLIAAGIGVFWYHQSLTPVKIIAGIAVFAGVFLVNQRRRA